MESAARVVRGLGQSAPFCLLIRVGAIKDHPDGAGEIYSPECEAFALSLPKPVASESGLRPTDRL